MRLTIFALAVLLPITVSSQQRPVNLAVDASQKQGVFPTSWAYFGYDEPNYTYTPNGRKLIRELVQLSPVPVHIRTHFLLASGDGKGGLKWGSTNAYTEDENGKPVYDWTVVDKILGTYVESGAIPFVEIGFMPKALSTHPDPYTPTWKPHGKSEDYNIGWTYPPSDYKKWEELIYQWVKHSVAKYGQAEVQKWDWEVWNEPNIGYWHGTPEEYDKLYDYAAAAVKRALPEARVGGPASTGPDNAKAAAFLRQFLEHCSTGRNAVTGQTGAPLDFISYHAKGRPQVLNGRVEMGLAQELKDVSKGFEIVRSFPQFQRLPIVLSEADPEGCAACSARVYPQNAYRNGTLYPSYEAVALKGLIELAAREHMNLQGILTWAFEFEDQPYFDGFRTLATNGVDKPVLNFFRLAGMMKGDIVKTESSDAVPLAALVSGGVPSRTVDGLAVAGPRKLSVMVWNYSDKDGAGDPADVTVRVSGLPANSRQLKVQQFRIDDTHSNAYTAWKEMGSPQHPNDSDYKKLESAGRLGEIDAPSVVKSREGECDLSLKLPMHGISLLQLTW